MRNQIERLERLRYRGVRLIGGYLIVGQTGLCRDQCVSVSQPIQVSLLAPYRQRRFAEDASSGEERLKRRLYWPRFFFQSFRRSFETDSSSYEEGSSLFWRLNKYMVLQCNCEYANNLDDDLVRLKTLEQVKNLSKKEKEQPWGLQCSLRDYQRLLPS